MERVETLSKMLVEKISKKASYTDILVTVKMIESELLHLNNINPTTKYEEKLTTHIDIFKTSVDRELDIEEEKIVEILQVDENEVQAELDEIKHNLTHLSYIGAKNKPAFKIEDENEGKVPLNELHTLPIEIVIAEPNKEMALEPIKEIIETDNGDVVQNLPKEINENLTTDNVMSINEMLNKQQHELSDKLKDTPIDDLKKAIGVNERFLYLNELFRGDDVMYDKSIKTINTFTTYEEAELWIRRELKLRLGWEDNYTTVKQFYELIRRRFS